MSKDVIFDRYARLYEIPLQLARLGHEVRGFCLSYHSKEEGTWAHGAYPGSLLWTSHSLGMMKLRAFRYPAKLVRELRLFKPDIIIGASDIPHVILGSWLAKRLCVPFMADLYDNFEGFGQARIPGFVPAFRRAVREAALVTTTSTPLRSLVVEQYGAQGKVVSMPSTIDSNVFKHGDKVSARKALGLPNDALLIGTAGGLYREKGIEPVYSAWSRIKTVHPNAHLVLAGPVEKSFPPPVGERVHLLGNLSHAQVAILFQALDVGVISILDTPFGRYCFPQKAYEMLACGLPVVSSRVGEMESLFADLPDVLFTPDDASSLIMALENQFHDFRLPIVRILSWEEAISEIEPIMIDLVGN